MSSNADEASSTTWKQPARLGQSVRSVQKYWYLYGSLMAFLLLNADRNWGSVLSIAVSFSLVFLLAQFWIKWLDDALSRGRKFKTYTLLTAIGVCWGTAEECCKRFADLCGSYVAPELLHVYCECFTIGCCVLGLMSLAYVYAALAILHHKILNVGEETNLFSGMSLGDKATLSAILVATLAYSAYAFLQTNALYASAQQFDAVYVSDSTELVAKNAYLWLTHPENDFRHPLFAVFAAPIAGIPFIVGKVFSQFCFVGPLLLNWSQIVLLLAGVYILTNILELSSWPRWGFLAISAFGYPYLLFSVMMEQYLVAFFWLMVALYVVKEKKQQSAIAFIGAGGTLLTGLAVVPFMSSCHPLRDTKRWLREVLWKVCQFLAVLLAVGRLDVIYNLPAKLSGLLWFTGYTLSLYDKVAQYSAFVAACFWAPAAGASNGEKTFFGSHLSWQMDPVTQISWGGVLVLALAVAGFAINRKNISSQIALGWLLFSGLLLVGIGWGTRENGLILYALYFGWAYLALIFQLAQALDKRIGRTVFVPGLVCIGVLGEAVVNLPAINEMLKFLAHNFPV